ncbi:MAG: Omp28-related outer membrane protein [Bacteroidetes bacterium]|nr:Omp28-related outer membrane protein [Bacteroidota bacterium]
MRPLLFAFVLIMAGFTTSFGQAKKYVIFEHFTNASCAPCASANPYFEAVAAVNKGKFHHIAYHTNWPGTDPMNAHNPTDVQTRVTYYGVTGVPDMEMQGNKYSGSPAGVTQEMLDNVASESSPIRLKVTETSNGTDRTVRVVVYTLATVPAATYKIRTAVVESEINYVTAPGSNGEKDFPNVMRKMLPTAAGDAYTPAAVGDSVVFTYTYTLNLVTWDTTRIYPVAFVQNETTKEILNSGSALDPAWELIPGDLSFEEGASGVPINFAAKLYNMAKVQGNFRIKFTATQPVDWTAALTFDGNPVTDSLDVIMSADELNDFALTVTPGTSVGLTTYYIIVQSLDDATLAPQVVQYNVVYGITDLIVHNAGGWTGGAPADFEQDYVNGLVSAGNTTYAATSYAVFEKGMAAQKLGGVGHIYFNVAWSFPSFTDDNILIFQNFMDNGGNLWVAGQDIGWETWDPSGYGTTATKAFYTNYLNASYGADGSTANNSVSANTADAVFGTVSTSTLVNVYGGSNMYPDQISPVGNGVNIFNYLNNVAKPAGVRATDGTYKVVYLGFDPPMVSDVAVRTEIVKLAHDWFHGIISADEYTAAMKTLNAAYPNPANSYLMIPVENAAVGAQVVVSDITGKTVFVESAFSGNNLKINTNTLNNGNYFYTITSNGKTTTGKFQVVR